MKQGALGLMQKRGSWWARKKIPTDLQRELGRSALTKNLDTTSKREATRRASAWIEQLESGFNAIRAGLAGDVDDPRTWVREFADRAVAKVEDMVANSVASTAATPQYAEDEARDLLADVAVDLAQGVDEGDPHDIDQALRMVGQDPDALAPMLKQAAAVAAIKALRGDHVRPAPMTPQVPAEVPIGLDAVQAAIADLAAKVDGQGKARDRKTVGDALEVFAQIKATEREESIEDLKLNGVYRDARRFAEFTGLDRVLDDVTTEDVIAWSDSLMDTRSKQGEPKPIAPRTKSKMVGAVITFLKVGEQRGWVVTNVAEGLRKGRKGKRSEERLPFDAEDFPKLFSTALWEQGEKRPERRWVPAIHLANGMRTNEACQLKLRDVVEEHGIPCFRILPDDPDQSTKNEESDRIVPIHPILIELGFLDYVAQRRAEADSEDEQLFPHLTWVKRTGYRSKVTAFFAGEKGYIRRNVTDNPKKVLYSLRHNFATACDRAEIPNTARTQLMGHSSSQSNDQGHITYISERLAHELLNQLKRVDFSEAFAGWLEIEKTEPVEPAKLAGGWKGE